MDEASSAIRDTAFSLYFALAFGVGGAWNAIMGWMIDYFGFDEAILTMAISYVVAGMLLLMKRK